MGTSIATSATASKRGSQPSSTDLRTLLSKGNRQKIGLIQAFMHDPELLILDEPTSGLDPLLQADFAELLEESVSRGRTVFLSSHDLDEVQRLAHQIAIIREGCIVAVDTVQDLRSKSPRTIELTFRRPVDTSELGRIPGTQVTASTGSRVSLTVDGEIGPVLASAAQMDVVDIVARPADLDELFRSYYHRHRGWVPVSGDIARWDLRLRRRSTLGYSVGSGRATRCSSWRSTPRSSTTRHWTR